MTRLQSPAMRQNSSQTQSESDSELSMRFVGETRKCSANDEASSRRKRRKTSTTRAKVEVGDREAPRRGHIGPVGQCSDSERADDEPEQQVRSTETSEGGEENDTRLPQLVQQAARSCSQKGARTRSSKLSLKSSPSPAQLTQANICGLSTNWQRARRNSSNSTGLELNCCQKVNTMDGSKNERTRMKIKKMVRRDEITNCDGKGETSQADAPECPPSGQASKVASMATPADRHQQSPAHKHRMQSLSRPESQSQHLSTLERRCRVGASQVRPTLASSRRFQLRELNLANTSLLFVNCLLVALILLSSRDQLIGSAEAAAGGPRQFIKDQPETQYLVPIGQDFILPCLIAHIQGECAWLHNGRILAPIQRKYSFAKLPENGDCSLLIRNASNSLDDGLWQCQVVSTDVDQPNLQSRDVNLIVLVPPEKPQIKNLSQGTKLILEENKQKIVTCEMRGGNPAPQIEWFLDGKNVTKDAQIASTIVGGQQGTAPATGSAVRVIQSKLKINDIRRSMNGKNLTCVGVHQTLNQSTQVELDVQYVPTVSVIQREYSIVEGSPLHIACQVDSNPPATLINWRLVNDGSQAAFGRNRSPTTMGSDKEAVVSNQKGGQLNFERIGREYNQNVFECLAQNSLGISTPAEVKLNVLYAPFLLNTSHSESVNVGTEARLECIFDGNPAPEIKWFYTDPLSRSASAMQIDQTNQGQNSNSNSNSNSHSNQNSSNRQHLQQLLLIKNVTYRNEGDYHCEARNAINGQVYAVRSSNIGLDVFGEPQILVKSPLSAKAVQGSKSDISLTFCSDPQPTRVYWQFGSIRLDVRTNFSTNGNGNNNNNNNGHQLAPLMPPGGGVGRHSGQPSAVGQRFQAHPLQALQKRDSSFSKVPTCFEAQLSLLDPELNDQRDYTLVVQNERSSASGTVRLRVTSPLSPALMITSAFVFICGLFLCSLLFLFILKKRQQLLAGATTTNTNGGGGGANGSLANGQHSRRSTSGGRATKNGVPKDLALVVGANGKQQQQQQDQNGAQQQNGGGGLLKMASAGQHHQTSGIVNGLGNGLANGACNSLGHHGQMTLGDEQAAGSKQTSAGLHLMSMASSDTSCNDQRQLLANSCGSDRNSSVSSSGGSGPGGATLGLGRDHTDYKSQSGRRGRGAASSSNRSTANSTPTTPMNHISVDDELHLNGSYQATESVTLGAQLSPNNLDMVGGGGGGPNGNALIYANIDYGAAAGAAAAAPTTMTARRTGNADSGHPDTDLGDSCSNDSLNLIAGHHHMAEQAGVGGDDSTRSLVRSKVGATIAMMNSLAAANQQQQLINTGTGYGHESTGALSDAINQQLAANSTRQSRRPGPPKPPKPSIQLRSRFYQQVQQANSGTGPGADLVMIGAGPGNELGHVLTTQAGATAAAGTTATTTHSSSSAASSPHPQQVSTMPSSVVEQQHKHHQAASPGDDLAAQYSRFAFPARAEL